MKNANIVGTIKRDTFNGGFFVDGTITPIPLYQGGDSKESIPSCTE